MLLATAATDPSLTGMGAVAAVLGAAIAWVARYTTQIHQQQQEYETKRQEQQREHDGQLLDRFDRLIDKVVVAHAEVADGINDRIARLTEEVRGLYKTS
jgi:formiminotetrahydrofolate cyclodeaminase